MRDLNLINNKHIPDIYKFSSIEQRLEVLRGIIGTDEALGKGQRSFVFTQQNKRLAEDIVLLARSCGLHAITRENKEGLSQRISIVTRKNLYYHIKEVKSIGVGDYYGFSVDKNNLFLDGNFIVQSNTGKTKLIGIIAALHLLCFRKSITRIQAPKLDQVKKFSFKEIEESLTSLGRLRKRDGKEVPTKWGFLLKFIKFTKEKIYIIGQERHWYIEAVTAPRGDSSNLPGQHQLSYLLIFDECSGIEEGHIQASLGALTDTFNSCIAFSQHTQQRGKFHDFVSMGVWAVVRLSSRYSPRVKIEQLKVMLATYTDDEIRVRIDGLPPKNENGMLIDIAAVHRAYHNTNRIFKQQFKSVAFSYDVGYSGLRDAHVIVTAETKSFTNEATGREKQAYKIVDIQRDKGESLKPLQFIKQRVFPHILSYLREKEEQGIYYDNVLVGGDATAGGSEAWDKLEELLLEGADYNFILSPIRWGSDKLYFEDKKRYINARAKAFVKIKEALDDNLLSIEIDRNKSFVIKELSSIPFVWSTKFLYKILSKEEMRRKAIPSPDTADSIAQLTLLQHVSEDEEYGEEYEEELDVDMENKERGNDEHYVDADIEQEGNVNLDILMPKTIGNINIEDDF